MPFILLVSLGPPLYKALGVKLMSHNVRFSRLADLDILTTDIDKNKPTVILLHGYGADHNDLVGLAGLVDPGKNFNWVFPNAPIALPMSFFGIGRAWFELDVATIEQRFVPGSPLNFAEYLPKGLDEAGVTIQKLVESLALNHGSIILGGFSQGAMVSCHAALTKLKPIKALLQLSSTLIARQLWQSKLEERNDLSIFQSHGIFDPVLPFEAAKKLSEIFQKNQSLAEFHPFQGGHEIPAPIIESLSQFLSQIKST